MSDKSIFTSLPAAAMDYFGRLGKDSYGFLQELKALTDADKSEIRQMLREVGYNKL